MFFILLLHINVAMIDRIFWVEGDWFNNGGTVDEQTIYAPLPDDPTCIRN